MFIFKKLYKMNVYQCIVDYGGPLVRPINKKLKDNITYEEYVKILPSLLPFLGTDGIWYNSINQIIYKEIEVID